MIFKKKSPRYSIFGRKKLKTFSITIQSSMYLEILAAAFNTTQSSLIEGLIIGLWNDKEKEILKNVPKKYIENKVYELLVEATTQENIKRKSRFGKRSGLPLKKSPLLKDEDDPFDIPIDMDAE